MFYICDELLDRYIDEDVRYPDETAPLLHFKGRATCAFVLREDACICCLDLCARIALRFECEFKSKFKDGDIALAKDVICEVSGDFNALHNCYKSIQILLEYSLKISTISRLMSDLAHDVNPKCSLFVTRKSFPFAKAICLKSAIAGGARVHRFGVYDGIVFFKSHLVAVKFDDFCKNLKQLQSELCGKRVIIEANSEDMAIELLKAGAIALQCDKFSVKSLAKIVKIRNEKFRSSTILAAGGINEINAGTIAQSGVDGLVSSRPFCAGVLDVGAKFSV